MASAYAARTISWICAGSEATSRLAAADEPEAALPSVAAIDDVTRWASTAPRTETPTAPPRERKNVTLALAAPMFRSATVPDRETRMRL